MRRDIYSEQQILQVAEEEFLEKGLKGAKPIVIARKSDTPLSVLHQYFQTKEDIFVEVFLKKLRTIAVALLRYKDKLPLSEFARQIIEQHFDDLAQNPRLAGFLYSEMISREDNRKLLIDRLSGRMNDIYTIIGKIIDAEVAKGNMRKIKSSDLILNVVSLNLFAVISCYNMLDYLPNKSPAYFDDFLKERRESNVQFILNALKP